MGDGGSKSGKEILRLVVIGMVGFLSMFGMWVEIEESGVK